MMMIVFLACCACVALASLPSAAAASGNRKMLDFHDDDINGGWQPLAAPIVATWNIY
jgi:hypothetical protein